MFSKDCCLQQFTLFYTFSSTWHFTFQRCLDSAQAVISQLRAPSPTQEAGRGWRTADRCPPNESGSSSQSLVPRLESSRKMNQTEIGKQKRKRETTKQPLTFTHWQLKLDSCMTEGGTAGQGVLEKDVALEESRFSFFLSDITIYFEALVISRWP